MGFKKLAGGLGVAVICSYMTLNEQDVFADDRVNEIYASDTRVRKSQLAEYEKIILDYIKGLKDNGLPDNFEINYSNEACGILMFKKDKATLSTNLKTIDSEEGLRFIAGDKYTQLIKKYDKAISLDFVNSRIIYAMGIAYKIVDDRTPEIGLIAISKAEERNGNLIMYNQEDSAGIDKFRKCEYASRENDKHVWEIRIISENIAPKSNLQIYFEAFKTLREIGLNRGI